MALTRSHFSVFLLAGAIWVSLMVALGAVGFDHYFKETLLESGDIAVNALQVDNAKHFRELYGNYSRFEFNHAAPAVRSETHPLVTPLSDAVRVKSEDRYSSAFIAVSHAARGYPMLVGTHP